MLDPNKIKKKVSVNDFIVLIRKYSPDQFEDSGHAFKRLSQKQRGLFTIKEVCNILLKNNPFLVGVQENDNYAAFYKFQGKNLRIIIRLERQKVKIVTFYYVLELQIPKI